MLTAINKVPNRGVAFEKGDDIIVVPALTTGQIRDNAAKFRLIIKSAEGSLNADEVSDETVDQVLDAKLDLILQAVKRNYPQAELTDILEFVTLENVNQMISAILGVSSEPKVKDVGELAPVNSTK